MKNEFVPYKQALALKELGFDEPCLTRFESYFDKTKLRAILATTSLCAPYENEYNGYDQKIINDQEKRWFFTGYKNSVKDHNENILSAPLFQQAFTWFREKYDKYGVVNIDLSNNLEDKIFVYMIEDKLGYIIDRSEEFNTYEEAELACLIKLIEIVKTKKQ